jgi:hypothetical protein
MQAYTKLMYIPEKVIKTYIKQGVIIFFIELRPSHVAFDNYECIISQDLSF